MMIWFRTISTRSSLPTSCDVQASWKLLSPGKAIIAAHNKNNNKDVSIVSRKQQQQQQQPLGFVSSSPSSSLPSGATIDNSVRNNYKMLSPIARAILLLFFIVACNYNSQFRLISNFVTQRQNVVQQLENAGHHHNTNWRNIQYNNGVFGDRDNPTRQEKEILKQCEELAAFHDGINNNYTCAGPILTDTTCCYCYFSRDGEQFGYIDQFFTNWSCAVPRNNSLFTTTTTAGDPSSSLAPLLLGTKDRPRVAWVTGKFGHGDLYKDEVDNLCTTVRNMNLIEPQDTFCYWDSPDSVVVVQDKRFSRHLKYRTDPNDVSAKGGGFWFHKSVLLHHHIMDQQYKDGDYLIWTDADRLDFFQLGTFHGVMEAMIRRRRRRGNSDDGDDLLIEVLGNSYEREFTKEDMLAAFHATPFMRDSPQVMANMIVVRHSPTMKRFLQAWMDCMADWHMVSDEPSVLPNAPDFYDHRHDQSVLSLFIKSFMTIQTVVGPPARPYQPHGGIMTYKFNDGADPICPFPSYRASIMLENVNGTL